MTEATQVDDAVRRHLGPLGRWKRMNCLETGLPDFYYRMRGCAGWLEDKLIPASGACPAHFTLDQLLWGENEVSFGGRWNLLGLRVIGRTRLWMLYDVMGARRWFEGIDNVPIMTAEGAFPTREIAFKLVPRGARECP